MQRKSVVTILMHMLKELADGNGDKEYRNPDFVFSEMDDNGSFDNLSGRQFNENYDNCCQLGDIFWDGSYTATVKEILINAVSYTGMPARMRLTIAELAADAINTKKPGVYTFNDSEEELVPLLLEKDSVCPEEETIVGEGMNASEEDEEEDVVIIRTKNDDSSKTSSQIYPPQEIKDYLDKYIYSQEEAKEAASMLLWEQLQGIKSNMVFIGPTGCGKTEIFRQLKKAYPDIYIVDASSITQDGWKGNFKIDDIFRRIGSIESAERSIIVMDEADKYFEPQINSGGENVSYSKQSELLKLIEGEELHIDGSVIDTSKISWVFLGSFELMLEGKRHVSNDVGFGGNVEKNQVSYIDHFTSEDLVKYAGVRREIAGRRGPGSNVQSRTVLR